VRLVLQPVSFHNFEIVPAAKDYQASFPTTRQSFATEAQSAQRENQIWGEGCNLSLDLGIRLKHLVNNPQKSRSCRINGHANFLFFNRFAVILQRSDGSFE
jgi:hypothetical protein